VLTMTEDQPKQHVDSGFFTAARDSCGAKVPGGGGLALGLGGEGSSAGLHYLRPEQPWDTRPRGGVAEPDMDSGSVSG